MCNYSFFPWAALYLLDPYFYTSLEQKSIGQSRNICNSINFSSNFLKNITIDFSF